MVLLSTLLLTSLSATSKKSSSDGSSNLNARALGILEQSCWTCHGAAQMAGLDLRTRESLLKGGGRGPALVPGDSDSSLLYQALTHLGDLKMPPGETRLSDEDLGVLKDWVDQGASWTDASEETDRADTGWWSFRKPQRPPVSENGMHSNRVRNPIDSFVFARLQAKNLAPAPEAGKLELVRRMYVDLIGLPPSPEEVEEFIKDTSSRAYLDLIDRLLDSPHYGERWARHWLDTVRYADSGGFETDEYYPNAWRYRDYTIKSFNEDKPYDRFVQEQIAADELWPDNLDLYETSYGIRPEKVEHMEALVGTSLFGFGPAIGESALDAPKLRNERLTDWVDTTASAFLGLTLGCARCHDHKFDPLSQRDYYRMQAIFAPSHPVRVPVVTEMSMFHRNEHYPRYIALDESRRAHEQFQARVEKRVTEAKKAEFPSEVVRAYEVPETDRSEEQSKLAAPLEEAITKLIPNGIFKLSDHLTPDEKQERAQLMMAIAEKVLELPLTDPSHNVRFDGFYDNPSARVLRHIQTELIPEVRVLERGDLDRPGEKVGPGLPTSLANGVKFDEESPYGPRYRKKLALWLTRPEHPLTARVMVNRIWQWHFGRGIVSTPNDFGSQGQPPSHPQLLDWLATEFVRQGWSLKSMHRLILQSSTYRMTSRFHREENALADPDNAYLWRANRRRLEAETLWDSIHSVAGNLNPKMYGRPVVPPLSENELAGFRLKWAWTVPADPAEHSRRGIYILSRRNFTFPMFQKFDTPDPAVSCPERSVTTVAPQSLWLMNNEAVFRQALIFAGRLIRKGGDEPRKWVQQAWETALGRDPSAAEVRESLKAMATADGKGWGKLPKGSPDEFESVDRSQAQGLTELCLAIFNLNEFLFVD